jgi:hypothetical protein
MSNINNNNYRKIDCRLVKDNYFDFMISNDDIIEENISEIVSQLNFSNLTDKFIVSNISWSNAKTSDSILHNIGYTGVDNGFITYEKDRIGNDEFLELYTNSKFDLSTFEDKFFVTEVNGNTQQYIYTINKEKDYTALKGGFYQGFFKIDGDEYQTLPNKIENEWEFNITLRDCDYETSDKILNKTHDNNEGIFFYIGTRSENKFWELYKQKPEMEKYKVNFIDVDNNVIEHEYIEDSPIDTEYCSDNGLMFEDAYLQEQIKLNDVNLIDSKGNTIGEKGFYEFETDNKFILFNRTKDGFNYKNWKDEYKVTLTGKTDSISINYFPYLNRGKNGYDKDNVNELIDNYSYSYNVFKDIENNALALKINNDGSISYRYLSTDCELIEEHTLPNIIKKNEWTDIRLKIVKKNRRNSCVETNVLGCMQLLIYVNGYLKLVSKEIPELNLKRINDTSERQEGIPYSISIGGGTQGLSERILLDYYDISDYILPLEKHFAGTFIGDIKEFSFKQK